MKLRLIHKLLTLPLVALIVCMAVVGGGVSWKLNRLIAGDAKTQLASLSALFEAVVADRMRRATAAMKMTVVQPSLYDGYFGAVVGDSAFLEQFLRQTQSLVGADDVLVVDEENRVLLRTGTDQGGDPVAFGSLLAPLWERATVAEADSQLDAVVSSSLSSWQDGVALITVGPVLDVETVVGALVFVKRMDDAFLLDQRQFFDDKVDLSLTTSTRVLATTLGGWNLPAQVPALGAELEQEFNGRPFRHRLTPLDGAGLFLGLSMDVGAQVAARHRVQVFLLVAFAVGLLAVGLLIYVSARAISTPLATMVATLEEIAEGEGDLTRQLAVGSRDEVGQLGESFNRFAQRLRDMVRRTRGVSGDLTGTNTQVAALSGQVSEGARTQSEALAEAYRAVEGIDESAAGVAESTRSLVTDAESSCVVIGEFNTSTDDIAREAERLAVTVEEVSMSIANMHAVSHQIMASVETLSASAQQTASAITQMDAGNREIQRSAETNDQLSEAASKDARRGKEEVEAAIEGIYSLRDMVDSSCGVIRKLGEDTTAISGILTVIDEVAEQTNLLALNAAILAAQAGDHGKGFAVVAGEIHELSERTASATTEIAALTDGFQRRAREAVASIEQGRQRVSAEVERSREVGGALDQIEVSSSKARQQVRDIVRGTQEQAHGSGQITQAVHQISVTLEQIAVAVRQHSGGLEELAEASASMRGIAAEVKSRSGRQAQGSQEIGNSMDRTRQMIRRIDEATRLQRARSAQLLEAVQRIRAIAEGNANRSDELDQVVDDLSRGTAALESEMGAFRV